MSGVKSVFCVKMYDEERHYENISGLNADELCKEFAGFAFPLVEMEQFGKRISEADYAYIQQGDNLLFSLDFDVNANTILLSDGENFDRKDMLETLLAMGPLKSSDVRSLAGSQRERDKGQETQNASAESAGQEDSQQAARRAKRGGR